MKKDYYEPEMEIVDFLGVDVITNSDPTGEGEGDF
jgi:hypothetical protein